MRGISDRGFGAIAQGLSQRGVDVETTLQALAAARGIKLASGSWLSLDIVYQLLLQAVEQTGDPDIGLCAYAFSHPGGLGPPSYAVMSSPTLGIALERLAKYLASAVTGSRLLIERAPGTFTITGIDEGVSPNSTPRCYIDVGAALLLGLIHWLVPEERPLPLSIEFPYSEPVDTLQLKMMFGGGLSFDAENLVLTFRDQVCDLPIITADSSLDTVHCNYADAWIKAIEGAVQARVRKAFAESSVESLLMSLEQVAECLGMTKRTLQKQLAKENASFSDLQDEYRRERAKNFLLNSSKNLKYISAALGFHELSSFHKACLRWFNVPPAQYRAEYGGVRQLS
ncbi:AraC family transcriptional regulator [Pseudomonas huaxiensis]|uniref:AraC family transcriptional regulator n=1 Tax=Pseudomonas huaxiensis TaxID=2213017 RepID=UPI0015B1DCCA|nr:AraC family transcriptional regulator [Pseudomonas huaxiensis]